MSPIFLQGWERKEHPHDSTEFRQRPGLSIGEVDKKLRKPGDTAFHIPMGGMFRYVSAANYFGELTEWVGWAIMTWSLPGLVFAIWTFANLGPRAHRHHNWYNQKFGDAYPKDRKRMIPFLY